MRVLLREWREWRLRRLLPLLCLCLLPTWAEAETYYIATTGNDTTGAGTIGAPWRTFQKAANTVMAGDTVNARGGTYQERWTSSANGTAVNRITYQAYSGESVIVDGGPITGTPVSNTWTVTINGDYTTLTGFSVTNCPWDCLIAWSGANTVTFDHLTVYHGLRTGIVFYANTGGIANANTIYDMYSVAQAGNADCMNVSSSGGPHTWTNNVVHDCGDDGLDAWLGVGNVLSGNISYHNGFVPFTSTTAGNGNGYKLGSSSGGGNNVVTDNVAWNNRLRGFDDNGGLNVKLYNNTAINNGGVNYRMEQSGGVLTNNISYGSLGSVSGQTLTTNSWQLGISNPLFVQITDPTLNTFARLQAGSPAINVGTTVVGSTHVCSGICDLGAFEYGGTPPDITPPAAPTGLQIIEILAAMVGLIQGRHLLFRGAMITVACCVTVSQMLPVYVARAHYEVKQHTANAILLALDWRKDKI
jgi:hypothetical protein